MSGRKTGAGLLTMRDPIEELEQEASFWREMLNECPEAGEDRCERMRDALLLAEFKLAQLEETKH